MIGRLNNTLFACALAVALFGATAMRAAADPILLSGSAFIDVSTGSGTGTGTADIGHQLFSFQGSAGDQVTLGVAVTQVLPSQYNDDDSKLFLFDGAGRLLALNDDFHGSLQSRIEAFTLPETGMYFVGVTSYPNDPLPGAIGAVITGWEDNGLSAFAFHLNVTRQAVQGGTSRDAPEPASLALFACGGLFLGTYRWRWRRRRGH